MWWTKWKSKVYIMPVHDRPKRQSVKKAQDAAAHAKAEAEREKAAAKARRAAAAESAAKKRTAKASVDSMTEEFAKMKIHDGGRRKRLTRRKAPRRGRHTRKA
jgi:membrane protein involved in colicin uptake